MIFKVPSNPNHSMILSPGGLGKERQLLPCLYGQRCPRAPWLRYQRKTIQKSQNPSMVGLEGTSVGHSVQPPAQAGSPRAGCTASRPGGVGISPEKETPQSLWATSPSLEGFKHRVDVALGDMVEQARWGWVGGWT